MKVPKENLVGPLNGGWTIAKRLLQYERQDIGSAGGAGQAAGRLAGPPIDDAGQELCRRRRDGRLADADLRARITDHMMEARRLRADRARAIAEEAKSNQGPSAPPRRS